MAKGIHPPRPGPGVAVLVYGLYNMHPLEEALRDRGFVVSIMSLNNQMHTTLKRLKVLLGGYHVIVSCNLNEMHIAEMELRTDKRWIELVSRDDYHAQVTEIMMKVRILSS